jgi:hypothetical protein
MIKEIYEVLVCKLFTNFNKGYNVLPLFIFDMFKKFQLHVYLFIILHHLKLIV